MIVGKITAKEHRGWVRVVITANTGEVLGIDLMRMRRGSFCGVWRRRWRLIDAVGRYM